MAQSQEPQRDGERAATSPDPVWEKIVRAILPPHLVDVTEYIGSGTGRYRDLQGSAGGRAATTGVIRHKPSRGGGRPKLDPKVACAKVHKAYRLAKDKLIRDGMDEDEPTVAQGALAIQFSESWFRRLRAVAGLGWPPAHTDMCRRYTKSDEQQSA